MSVKVSKTKIRLKTGAKNALMTIITMQTATQQHDNLKVQGIDALMAFFWFHSRLTRVRFLLSNISSSPPTRPKKPTWLALWKSSWETECTGGRGRNLLNRRKQKKKIQEKNTNRSPPKHPIYPLDSLSPLPPVADKRSPEELLTKQNEESVPAPSPGLGPPSVHHLARWEEFGRREPHTESGVIYDVCMQSLPVWFDLPRRCARALLLARWLWGLHKGRVVVSFLLKSRRCADYIKKEEWYNLSVYNLNVCILDASVASDY